MTFGTGQKKRSFENQEASSQFKESYLSIAGHSNHSIEKGGTIE
jgi:hypothetical protein